MRVAGAGRHDGRCAGRMLPYELVGTDDFRPDLSALETMVVLDVLLQDLYLAASHGGERGFVRRRRDARAQAGLHHEGNLGQVRLDGQLR